MNKIEFQLSPIEREGKRVLTTAQLAEAYNTDSKVISYNFNHNKSHYIEGVHYYRLTGDELKKFFAIVNFTNANSSKIRVLYLWTERGALLHAKSVNTDKAWEVYEFLVDNYFRTREMSNSYTEVIEMYKNINKRFDRLERKIDALEYKADTSECKVDILEYKIDRLEKKVDIIAKHSDTIIKDIKKMVVDATNHVVIPCVSFIYEKFIK